MVKILILTRPQVLELTQKSERTIRDLQQKVARLEGEVATHQAGVEELERDHKTRVDNITEQKTLMEVSGWAWSGEGVVWQFCSFSKKI